MSVHAGQLLIPVAEIELSVLARQCLAQRIPDAETLEREVAAWVAARNDVVVNLLILGMAGLTALVGTGWPDLVLGVVIVLLNVRAASEVWELAEEERLAARALAGEALD